VVDIDYDFFQFAEAMRRALKISKTIAVIGFIDAYRLAERAVDYIRRSDETVFVRILETSAFVKILSGILLIKALRFLLAEIPWYGMPAVLVVKVSMWNLMINYWKLQ
jgi:hypothetical protein